MKRILKLNYKRLVMDVIAENKVKESQGYQKLEQEIKSFKIAAWILVGVGFFAFAIGVGSMLDGEAKWAQLAGDFSGGVVASFWSLAGIMLVYIAFLGQRQQLMLQEEELRLSREELAATREELKGQKEQLQEQSKTAALQRFENTYFTLVSNLVNRLNGLQGGGRPLAVGQQIYSKFRSHLAAYYQRVQDKQDSSRLDKIRDSFLQAKKAILNGMSQGNPVQLFNDIYLTLDFIEKSSLSRREKAFYYDLIFTKFSSSTVSILLYHSLLEEFSEKRLYIVYFTSGGKAYPLSKYLLDDSHRPLFMLTDEEIELLST